MRPAREGKAEKERGRRGGGQVPGAHCDGTPHRQGDTGQGALGGRGARGGGHVLRAAGLPKLWHELPARWAAALEMPDERSRTQWPSNAHTLALTATTTTRLCVRTASHNSYSAFSTNTSARTHTHTQTRTLGKDELGQLGWSNRTAPAAAGH